MSIDHHEVAILAAELHAVDVEPGARRAVSDVGDDVAQRAQAAAPVLTGTLKASIRARARGLEVIASAEARYAAYVEYGTSVMAPQPFMGPALDGASVQLAAELGDAGRDALS